MTSADRWKRVESILDELLELPEDRRAARLVALAAGDAALREEVLALLAEGAKAGGVLDGSLETLVGDAAGRDEAPVEGLRIGPYRVLGRLGRGGMGDVLLAERADGQFDHRVALKLVRAGLDRVEIAARFRHERQILARLRHPNIAALLEGGTTEDGSPYFAMEVVEGERVTDFADRRRLDVDARLRLFEPVCAAVAYAHRNLVVHRDIKPGNVLVTAEGTVKLLDFGIAKLLDPESGDDAARTTHAFLTPAYASPEQAAGRPTSTATDVYSLGVLLYELLTGHHPHGDTSISAEVLRSLLEADPPDASAVVTRDTREATAAEVAHRRASEPRGLRRRLRGDLDNIVGKALRRVPEERYASVEDLRADLQRHRLSLPVAARPATARYRLRKFVRRNRVAVAAGGALLLALLVFAAGMSVLYARAQANLARALEAEREAKREATTADRTASFLFNLFQVSDPKSSSWENLTARQILERAAKRIETDLADEPLVRARILGNLATVHAGLGRREEARAFHERGLALRRQAGANDDLAYARALNYYGNFLRESADYPGARRAHQEALAIREARLDSNHVDIAESLTSLGVFYSAVGRLDSSLACQQRALAIKRRALGPDHDDVGTSHFNLGWLHLQRNLDHVRARASFEEAHRIFLLTRGETNSRTLATLSGIALTRELAGDLEGSREAMERVVKLLEESLGPDHPDLAQQVFRLAMVERRLGHTASALGLAERALGIARRAHPGPHPQVAVTLGGVAEVRADAGETKAALELARGALAILDSLGLRTALTMEAHHRIGVLERRLGRLPASRAAYARALSIAEAVFGPDHAETARRRGNLATVDSLLAERR